VLRILVVDDEADVRTMISVVLRVHRFEFVEAASGAAALKAFEDSSFDVAIVDAFLHGNQRFRPHHHDARMHIGSRGRRHIGDGETNAPANRDAICDLRTLVSLRALVGYEPL
jgi:DNA-binding NarL/FixJ family response regulator